MNTKLISIILFVCVIGLVIVLIMGGSTDKLEQEYKRLEAQRDSLSDRIGVLEVQNDSIIKADLAHIKQIDSAKQADTLIVERVNTRNDEYKEFYNYLDTASRVERYKYFGSVLTTFEPQRP